MKNKGFIQVVTVLLAVVTIYQLSFTLVTRNVESNARNQAEIIKKDTTVKDSENEVYKRIIDSMRSVVVYPLKFTNYTYDDCKKREINLGLDLQGGMNVTLEVSAPGLIRALAGKDIDDKDFLDALAEAEKEFLGQQNFVDLFSQKYEAKHPGTGLARIFYTKELSEQFQLQSPNEEVYSYLKKELAGASDRTYKIVKARIDNFAVTQPNVQKLDNGRIMVELPGVDNPDRVRKLLQSSAKLEFWKVYPTQEAYGYMVAADKVVGRLEAEKHGWDEAKDTTAKEAEKFEAIDVNAPVEVNVNDTVAVDTGGVEVEIPEAPIAGVDTGVKDTAGADKQNMTEADFKRQNPLQSRILPNASETEWGGGGFVGWVRTQDQKFVMEYLNNEEVMAAYPESVRFRWSFKPDVIQNAEMFKLYALKATPAGNPDLHGDVVADANVSFNERGEAEVVMSMNTEGTRVWGIITQEAYDAGKQQIAIVLDSAVYSAPNVINPILDGRSNITGGFSLEEATDLANILKAGRLDAPANIIEEAVVGPSLGKASIKAGLISLVIGFAMVILFMILYYSKAGVYAVVALLTNLFFILGVLAGYGAALTLPGMAGLVLTIGMAVDANVLVFERIKEELATGKGFKAAVKNGYMAAYSSIVDANVTTLIAAIFLMRFGKGPVAGFAVILLIGILSSLFTAIFLTRLFVERDIKKGVDTSFSGSFGKRLFQKANYNFIGKRKVFYIISGTIIALGIGSMFTRGLSQGVDLKGGWSFIVKVENASLEDVKSALSSEITESIEVKTYGADGQYKVTTSYLINETQGNPSEVVKGKLIEGLKNYNVTNDSILSESKVGPTIAEDIRRDSTMAIVLSLIGMFIYIVLRFRKWGFGLGATIALFHDVLIVFSIFSIFHGILPFSMDIDQAFIAAILTVVGYSINDTVVVFDRVREFLKIHKFEKNTGQVINSAINQTLSRTMVTSFTTLIVVLILFLAGGEGLKGFTFALLVGVAVGTYSSIFIATPIVVDVTGEQRKIKKKD